MQDPMCRAAQPNEGENLQSVRDECMVCVWVAKTFTLFREICKPTNVEYDCNTIVNQYHRKIHGKIIQTHFQKHTKKRKTS